MRTVDPTNYIGNDAALATAGTGGPVTDYVTLSQFVYDRLKSKYYDGIQSFYPEPAPVAFIDIYSTAVQATYSDVSEWIDLADYQWFSMVPQVITLAAASTSKEKLQWCHDPSAASPVIFDDTVDVQAAPGGGETVLSQDIAVKAVSTAAAAVLPLASRVVQKKARFVRIAQTCAVLAPIKVRFHYSMF